ncbi:hypothetical protein DI09_8p260 [Mitosporidium daphniae]|uniref:C3H1-type domain-containing protein n=1 Tax=Mitosporidium daphniae TaxID=1485682 RepID=A0A098VLV2_9MICR|nr:uncharacterized protein DI09_8p260 [Mitosporidium daphniae]KGG50087.1 hypothetical protein DI09_8p260 [Mitosporidium daphniae]|eukprot:XP_013236514.1 uncharacterized protein DI09_8p260 [Mitosporidium daphniae]
MMMSLSPCSQVDMFMQRCTSPTLTHEEKTNLLSGLARSTPEALSKLFSKKEAIAALQEWTLLANHSREDLLIAVLALHNLNLLPWNLTELQQYKLGRTVKLASSLVVKSDKFECELKKMLMTIEEGPPNLLIKREVILNEVGDDGTKSAATHISIKKDLLDGSRNTGKNHGLISSKRAISTQGVDFGKANVADLNSHQPNKHEGMAKSGDTANPISVKGAVPFDPFECHSIINKKSSPARQPAPEKGGPALMTQKTSIPAAPNDTRVSFKPDEQLMQVCLFELDPTERKNPNFNPAMAYGDLNDNDEAFLSLKIKETEDLYRPYSSVNSPMLIPTMKWKLPKKLQFNEHYTLADGANSLERSRQREQRTNNTDLYRCTDLSRCPSNPIESPPYMLSSQPPITIPLHPISSAPQPVEHIDENALDSLLGSLASPSHGLFDSMVGHQEYAYPNYQHYAMPTQGYPPPQLLYPQANYPQCTLVSPPQANMHQIPGTQSLQTQQATPKIRQINCPPEKLRRVRCHYYDPKNPVACARGDNCTFLHQ